jgi:sigma-B regulation protein RsbU (phosphoserine phosphatase)
VRKHGKMTIRMAYEMVMPYHLHMPSYFLETFTEYPFLYMGILEEWGIILVIWGR